MRLNDYITLIVSILALLVSIMSLLITFLNHKRNSTKLEIRQLKFRPGVLDIKTRPNMLYLDRSQDSSLWEVVPLLYLIVYLEIKNLSHTGITISNFIINDIILFSKANMVKFEKELPLCYFSSKKSFDKNMGVYNCTCPIVHTILKPEHYDMINVGDRIESKSSIEGVIILEGNQILYNAVIDGVNKFTIVTPDKKFDVYVEIDKTIIPKFHKE